PANWEQLEQRGWQRLAQVRNLVLLSGLFRRPLEVWVLLDGALFLQESGYRVRLGQSCEYQLTTRNLLLTAEKIRPHRTPMLLTGCAQSYPQESVIHSYPRLLCIKMLMTPWQLVGNLAWRGLQRSVQKITSLNNYEQTRG